MSTLRFTKMHGIGNDYVYVDGADQRVDDPAGLSRAISHRHFGVGSDGLILVLPPSAGVEADVRMRMFNADGSESEMCGNGVRCVCKFAHDRGLSRAHPMRVETGAGVLTLSYTRDDGGLVDRVKVDMGAPVLEAARIPVAMDVPDDERVVDHDLAAYLDPPIDLAPGAGGPDDLRATCVSMGNPHAVLFTTNVEGVALATLGPRIEHLAAFPRRVNLHVVSADSPSELTMRTWERGSGATLACGTGAAAVCVAGVLTGRTERSVLAHLPGGDLHLHWDERTDHVEMTGPAVEVFSGVWPIG
jgi:diaminopimelate epimerase